MTIEQAADLSVKLIQVAIVPAVGAALLMLTSMRSEINEGVEVIRADVARIDNRLIRQEEWRHSHDKQDDERHDRHEAQIEELFHRSPPPERANGSGHR